MAFIEQHSDWVFLYEKLEKGVSGYKLSVAQRDVMMEIKGMAEQNMFDILLVFMFDRLGRREDETPFLVEWFIDHGIEVWSTREGQTRLDNRGDKLINYIRYWQAGGESEKTSVRVKAAQSQMTTDGYWRGGSIPFGYHLVHKGRISKKKHELWDLEVDDQEAELVRIIFDMYCNDGIGTYRIANYLNARYPSENKIWTAQTIRSMLSNVTYTGRMHMNDLCSDPIPELRIISDDTFNFVQNIIKRHIQSRYPDIRQKEKYQLPFDDSTKASLFGASMLSGLIYCAHCGHKLVGGYCTKHQKSQVYHRPVYRCYTKNTAAKNCTGQYVYSGIRVDSVVVDALKQYFKNIKMSIDSEWREKVRDVIATRLIKKIEELEKRLVDLQAEEQMLKEEAIKTLHGKSDYSKELLGEMFVKNRVAIEHCMTEINHCHSEQAAAEGHVKYLVEQYKYVCDWEDKFDYAPDDIKKMIAARFIEHITIDRNYRITIYFYISADDFHFDFPDDSSEVNIVMTEHPMVQVFDSSVGIPELKKEHKPKA